MVLTPILNLTSLPFLLPVLSSSLSQLVCPKLCSAGNQIAGFPPPKLQALFSIAQAAKESVVKTLASSLTRLSCRTVWSKDAFLRGTSQTHHVKHLKEVKLTVVCGEHRPPQFHL